MIGSGMTVHITEAEVARDLHAVLEKVGQSVEVIIEQDSRPIAVIKAAVVEGRNISEVIAALEASGANAVIGREFRPGPGRRGRSQGPPRTMEPVVATPILPSVSINRRAFGFGST